MTTHDPEHATDTCTSCGTAVYFVSNTHLIVAQHQIEDLDHPPATALGQALEILVRLLRVFIMSAQIGGPAFLIGAALQPVLKQLNAVQEELNHVSSGCAPGVQGRLDNTVAQILATGVAVPDDISDLN